MARLGQDRCHERDDWRRPGPPASLDLMQRDKPVVIVGAGVAGLAAARRLRVAGVETILIEAADRIGGRAHTVVTEGWAFDHGASWLHAAERNPLVPLADPADLRPSDALGAEHVFIGDQPASEAERAAYHAAWDRLEETVAPALAAGEDCSLAEAMAPMREDPWAATAAGWEGAIIAAADADALSLRDWHVNGLDGTNLLVRGGLGAFIARRLATDVQLRMAAEVIHWGGIGVRVETSRGVVDAASCIVTVSTGVLAAGAIRFHPALPAWLEGAIHGLPMGLLSKVALRGCLGFAPEDHLVAQMAPGSARMVFIAQPDGADRILGFVGGRAAWAVAPDPRAVIALAQAELRSMLGRTPDAAGAIVTDWGTNPLFRGSYAYAPPGQAGMRGVLGQAFLAERLVFAGEATRTDGLAGTVGGAYLSGIEAADRLLGTWKINP